MSRRYRKPPIVEAVCEFRFEPGEWDGAMFGLIWECVKEPFPRRQDVQKLDLEIVSKPSGAEQKMTQTPMVKYAAEDQRLFMQVGPHTMSVHHLKPYTSWDEFRPLVKIAFDAYWGKAKPRALTRIGLRYINRVEMPGPTVELEDYLDFRPLVGPALPREQKSFIVGVEFPFDDGRDALRLQVASTQSESDTIVPLILDLDYFTLRPDGVSVDTVDSWLESAHGRIEEAFEAAITQKLRSSFEQAG